MRTGGWGDRERSRPVYIPVNTRVVTLAEHEAMKREIAAGWRLQNGVDVVGNPHLIRAMQDIKPLPWKWIGFGALVALMAWWTLSA